MSPTLSDYTTEILGKKETIEKVEGYKCTSCGVVEFDLNESIKKRIQEKLTARRIELLKDKNVTRILITNIKKIRKEKNVSQKQLAEALSFTEQRFGAVERNFNIPTVPLFYDISELLNVEVGELYSRVYIDTKFYNKLNLIDADFKKIPELEDYRNNLQTLDEEHKKIQNTTRSLNSKIKKVEKLINATDNGDKNEYVKLAESLKVELALGDIESKDDIRKEANRVKVLLTECINKGDARVEEIKREKEEITPTLKKLERNCILKQGSCIDYFDWIKLKEVFKDELKEGFLVGDTLDKAEDLNILEEENYGETDYDNEEA